MAEISKIKVGEVSYDIKDPVAREALSGLTGAMHFLGTTTDALSEGSNLSSINIQGKDGAVTAQSGDVVVYQDMEYVYNGSTWNKFGPAGSFGALAFKEEATGTVKAVGQNAASAVTLTGGATGKLETTTIYAVEGNETVHDTPTANNENVGSASGWSAGTMFKAEVSSEELVLTPGEAPALTIAEKSVVVGLTEGTAKTVAKAAADGVTVATGSVSAEGTGATVATSLPTGGTAAAQEFTGSDVQVTVK